MPGQPAQPVSLPGGRIAMVRVDRSGTPTVKLRLSSDGGRTWPAGGEATLHEPRLRSQTLVKTSMSETWTEMENFSLGLPAATALPGGDILVVYYAGPDPDLTASGRLSPRAHRVRRSDLRGRGQSCPVREICLAHAGRITLGNGRGGNGLTVEVILPLALPTV